MTGSRPSALIAEDEPLLARELAAALGRVWPALEIVATAGDGERAIALLAQHRPDVAFLDVRMPGTNGVQVAAQAPAGTAIVFVTAYEQYAVDAFEHAAIDYLLKPVTDARLERCVARLRERLGPRADDAHGAVGDARVDPALLARLAEALQPKPSFLRFLRAGVGDTIHQIPIDEVLYLEAKDKYVSVVTASAQPLVRVPLAELAQQLDPQRFTQIHRSTIVNVDAIESIRRDFAGRLYVHLRGRSERLPVSRAYAAQFRGM